MSIPLPNLMLNAVQFGVVDAILICVLVVLLFLSAFFSSSETAFSTANSIRMKNYVEEKRKGARKALYIMEHYDKTLATILVGNNFVNIASTPKIIAHMVVLAILVGNNFVNIASTTICAIIFGMLFVNPTLANILNTVIMTIIVLIFGEILPKAMAKANAEKFALRFSGIMFVLIKVMYPITILFMLLQKAVLKKSKAEDNPTVTEDELESIIDTMEEEGVLDANDADIFQGVMDLDEQSIYDIMTPRVDVIAVSIDSKIEELQKVFLESGYSRLPVYEEDKDHMIGIVHIKDFIAKVLNKDKFVIKDIMSEPIFVSENMKAKELIRKMQQEKKHMAIVIDEHGGTSGIVTFEDVMEEMVGDIYDEHDDEVIVPSLIKVSDNTYDVDPDINLEDLFEQLEIENVPETEYSSLGGYLYELCENLPEVNQKLEVIAIDEQMDDHGNLISKTITMEFTLTEVEDMRIKKVRLVIDPIKPEDAINKEEK